VAWHWEGYHGLRLVHRQAPSGDALAGEAFAFSEVDLRIPAYQGEKGGVYLGFIRRLWRLEVPEEADATSTRWDAIHSYEGALGAAYIQNNRWSYYGEYNPNWSGTRVHWDGAHLRHNAMLVACRTFSSDLTLNFGAGAMWGYLDLFPYPIVGAQWEFHPGWALDALIPSYAFLRWRFLPRWETGWRFQLLELESLKQHEEIPEAQALTLFHVETGPYLEVQAWKWIWLRMATGLPVYQSYVWADRSWEEVRPLPQPQSWLISVAGRVVF
jgi:hypothetical protein